MSFHPIANALHRHLFSAQYFLVDENAADRHIRPAIVGIVIDAKNGSIFEPNSGRALDLREQNVDLVVQVADFKMPAVERAILNLAAIVVGHNLAAPDATTDEHALGWKRIAELTPAGGYEIRRPAIK